MKQRYDVAIVGGGNAALCAALEASEAGAKVVVLEAATPHMRGGNSRHTRNVRCVHLGEVNFLGGSYAPEEFYADLLQVTGGETNEDLARFTIEQSEALGDWMTAHGIRWQGALRGTLQLNRTNAFFLGGGKALLNTYYDAAQRRGVDVVYESPVTDLVLQSECSAVVYEQAGERREVEAKAVVVASGGFEANLEWLGEYWGEAAKNFMIRGTPNNRGRMLRVLLDQGAKPVGNPREFHAVAVDARGPQFDGGIVTRLDSIPFGVTVNRDGRRFADEGEDVWPKRYASWGGLIARQPDQIAFSIVDAKQRDEFLPSLFPPIEAGSIRELALTLKLDPEALDETLTQYNAAVQPGTYDISKLDDCHTEGLELPKSHWALGIDTPPYFAYPLRPGITFTYLGLTVNREAQVIAAEGEQPMPGLYAAGEVMAGNILGRGYMAGFGMTIGTVFGRIAGREAARYALG